MRMPGGGEGSEGERWERGGDGKRCEGGDANREGIVKGPLQQQIQVYTMCAVLRSELRFEEG